MGLDVLYPGDLRSVDLNLDLNLDIVAIHGLNGHPRRTWTEPRSQKLWLRDFLSEDLPKARVMTFGYNATAMFDKSMADIVDHARDLLECLLEKRKEVYETIRPLIFIGHSLGGLVTKQALTLAGNEQRFKNIYTSAAGIMFFGTPHQGSSFASYALFLAKVPTELALKPDPQLLRTLKIGSEVLKKLTSGFKEHHQKRQYPIVSFYETKTMTGLKKLIVEKTSAIMTPAHEKSDEEKIPVPADHRKMCQFSSPKDQTYIRAVAAIQRIHTNGNDSAIPRNELCILPDRLNPLFTGRDEIRQKLQDCLLPDRYARARDQQRYVLFGLGGSGKTQLALRFAHDFKEQFKSIFWVDATTLSMASDSFISIANMCSLDQNMDSVKAWLASTDHWLLIIDNADDPNLDISKLFPSGSRGTILITTRNPDVQKFASAGTSKVDELCDEDAVTLLLKASTSSSIQDPRARGAALEVVQILGNLALAIVQAGAVIRQGICGLDGFCELYSLQKRRLLELGRPIASIDYQFSIFTTWEISLQKIEEMKTSEAYFALELLRSFSFMHFDGIREETFRNARQNLQYSREGSNFQRTSTYRLMPSGWDPLMFAKALSILVGFSLITLNDSRHISMHPLVHEWSRDRMSPEQRARTWDMVASTLAMSIQPDFKIPEFYQYRRSLLPNIDACVNSEEGKSMLFSVGPQVEERMTMAERFAMVYGESYRYPEALSLATGVLHWKRSALPSENPVISQSMGDVATCLTNLCRYREATDLREELLKLAQKRSGVDSREMLAAMRELAKSYEDLGKYQTACALLEETSNRLKSVYGDEDMDTLQAKVCLAICYSRLERWQDAVKLQKNVVQVSQRILGEASSFTLVAMENLAVYYQGLNKKKKAKRIREQSLAAFKVTFGEDHPNTAMAVASSTRDDSWSQRKQSIAIVNKALRQMQDTLGDRDIRTLNCMERLIEKNFACGALKKARAMQEKVLSGMAEVLGHDHPQTIANRKELARINMALAARKVCYWWLPEKIVE